MANESARSSAMRPAFPRRAIIGFTGAFLCAGCVTAKGTTGERSLPATPRPACDLAAASPWITKWLAAWQLTSERILQIPAAPPPDMVLFDTKCVYATSELSAAGPAIALPGSALLWRTALHNDTVTTPASKKLPVQLMTFTDVDKRTRRPFFVMASPDYWASKGFGAEPGLTAVFIHEFSHTRQIPGLGSIIGPIDDAWRFPDELDDDAVQTRFKSDSAYVAAYMAERNLLYRAAEADSLAEVRRLAMEALAMIRARHAKWFVGENAVFSTLDDTFLSLEGAAQWAAHAWLAHPEGGALSKPAAVARMLGSRRFWAQDEGLALFLVVDRLMADWPKLVFREPSVGGITLLQWAIDHAG